MENIIIRNIEEKDIPSVVDIQIDGWKSAYKGIVDDNVSNYNVFHTLSHFQFVIYLSSKNFVSVLFLSSNSICSFSDFVSVL